MSRKDQYYHRCCWEKYMVTRNGCLQKSRMTNFWATECSLQTTLRARSFGFLLLVLSLTAALKRAAYLFTTKEWFMATSKFRYKYFRTCPDAGLKNIFNFCSVLPILLYKPSSQYWPSTEPSIAPLNNEMTPRP